MNIEKLRFVLQESFRNVPFYKKLKSLLPYNDFTFETIDRFYDIPITNKQIIRDQANEFINTSVNINNCDVQHTSGTTGIPLKIIRSRNEQLQISLILLKLRKQYCPEILKQRTAEFWPIQKPYQYLTRNRVQTLLLSSKYSASKEILSELEIFNPAVIQGYASSLLSLATTIKESSMLLKATNLNFIENRSEFLLPEHREMIQKVFNVPVINYYGSREFWPIAYDCKEGKLHVVSENVYIEVLREDGSVCREGEYGKLIITGLSTTAMPFIRYDIGDIGCLTENTCNCGNQEPVLDLMFGRSNETVETPFGSISASHVRVFFSDLFKLLEAHDVVQVQLHQLNIYMFELLIVSRNRKDTTDISKIEEVLKINLGYPLKLKVHYVKEISPNPINGKVSSFIPIKKERLVK
ncbi:MULTISPECIES: phenylacetate--CoA ligase family protein [Paenibacillus]|uniref:Phenylacetate-coenzyme A ligase PaaK-like adenylate-forming protein n=1 Tax=Paenibacillus pabuli TaxID=1472 RepID=A0A855Y5R0_9BACL|nr:MULTISPECIES: phenylacetate--CoA ligase family protein [Paenibacillus]PWW44317.1 phenylacetate-coenzyme A ligase PaaK-like adenylate-forming protein [Paenibacillus pabuli]PXW10345.1 phenylacetate-coenzyme A ligase PaaK-like adenylate-forming protein [Paenibacillus taichungensis]